MRPYLSLLLTLYVLSTKGQSHAQEASSQLADAFCQCMEQIDTGPYRGRFKGLCLCDDRVLSTHVPGFMRAEREAQGKRMEHEHARLAWQVHDAVLLAALRQCKLSLDEPVTDTAAFIARLRREREIANEFGRRIHERQVQATQAFMSGLLNADTSMAAYFFADDAYYMNVAPQLRQLVSELQRAQTNGFMGSSRVEGGLNIAYATVLTPSNTALLRIELTYRPDDAYAKAIAFKVIPGDQIHETFDIPPPPPPMDMQGIETVPTEDLPPPPPRQK